MRYTEHEEKKRKGGFTMEDFLAKIKEIINKLVETIKSLVARFKALVGGEEETSD